uniref:Uncharacterized protein n=1 Tax=Rhizobium meliloti TaxID=382 RepID=A0A0D4DCU4_RHIML|nr:hypothetical protein [Sinorhizobium meliloti]
MTAAPNARSISTMSWGLLQKPIEQIGRVSRQVMAVVVRKIVEGGKPLAAFGFLHRRFQPFVRKRQL